jgi:hypothetical protein
MTLAAFSQDRRSSMALSVLSGGMNAIKQHETRFVRFVAGPEPRFVTSR